MDSGGCNETSNIPPYVPPNESITISSISNAAYPAGVCSKEWILYIQHFFSITCIRPSSK